jgi:hypothetical protein
MLASFLSPPTGIIIIPQKKERKKGLNKISLPKFSAGHQLPHQKKVRTLGVCGCVTHQFNGPKKKKRKIGKTKYVIQDISPERF